MDSKENLNVSTDDYENVYRLPNTINPIRYKLTIDPDMANGTFNGDMIIDIEVVESTRRIILHSHLLTINSIKVHVSTESRTTDPSIAKSHPVQNVYVQKKRQLIIITLEDILPAGQFSIFMTYSGHLNSESVGLYRTRIGNSNPCSSPSRYCMVTYFEPTYARFAYPCFDEPHFKAKYSTTLVRPSTGDYIALSNSSVKMEVADFPRPGVTSVHFNETPPISSYLTCFIIGIFKRLEPAMAIDNNVPVSVYSLPELVKSTSIARDLAAKVLDYFSKYFLIDYPFPKLDLIAIPDSQLGGMENWGLITFRASCLILSDDSSTLDFLRVVKIIIHELSHMWFGNLVTIAWWNDTWLKEGMADFMSFIGGNHSYPAWYNEWVFLSSQVYPALQKDSALSSRPVVLDVSHPDQIREMFDSISYLKGSCLFRMLHDIDNVKFHRGLTNYVHKMKWSAAQTSDLWGCLSESFGWPVGEVMGPWTKLPGYPLVTVTIENNSFIVTHSRFSNDSFKTECDPTHKSLWDIPIKYFTSSNKKDVKLFWFYGKKSSSEIVPTTYSDEWIKLNWHNVGFYRVNYPTSLWLKFAEILKEDICVFDPEDRCNLINDAFCLASAGYIKYDVPLTLISYLKKGGETNFLVWSIVRDHLERMQALLSKTNTSQMFKNYIHDLLMPVVSSLNWDTGDDVSYMERKLRTEIISFACLMNFEDVLSKVSSLYEDWIRKKTAKPNKEIRSIVFTYALSQTQNKELWEKTWDLYLREHNPSEVLNYLRALASIHDPDIITRLLAEAKNTDIIRSQDFFILLRLISKSDIGNKMVWSFIVNEWPYFVERFTLNDRQLGLIISFVTSHFCTVEQRKEVDNFFHKYPEAGAGTSERKHTLETINANIKWLQSHKCFIDNWLQ